MENTEFKNLLTLLESANEDSFRLGLVLAHFSIAKGGVNTSEIFNLWLKYT